ncbi:hypothetical protein L0Y40_01540 [Candidatus Wolfebacteria bacterium]|nr:hypothetical protein [Candidatus Wolfebacteria bacterium]
MLLREHHAYLVTRKWGEVHKILAAHIEREFGVALRGNPDYWLEVFDTLSIDDARVLAERALRKPVGGEIKIFVIAFNFITSEAQNALLKMFEEPTPGTHFFVVTSLGDTLLPTLRSRLAVLRITDNKQSRRPAESGLRLQTSELTTDNKAEEFLRGGTEARLKLIEPIVEEKDKAGALALLDGVERELYHKADLVKIDGEVSFALGELLNMRGYLRDRAPSVKMILEYMALVVPRR